jgi:hypothetical protein
VFENPPIAAQGSAPTLETVFSALLLAPAEYDFRTELSGPPPRKKGLITCSPVERGLGLRLRLFVHRREEYELRNENQVLRTGGTVSLLSNDELGRVLGARVLRVVYPGRWTKITMSASCSIDPESRKSLSCGS